MLRLISIVLLIYSFFVIQTSIPTLPSRIPTHFNAEGVANGWGSPDTLWILFGAQALVSLVFLTIPLLSQIIPGAIHFGTRRLSDFPPDKQPQMISMLNDMAACMSIVINVFFVFFVTDMVRAVAQPIPHLHPVMPLVLLFAGMFAVLFYYGARFYRAANDVIGGNPQSKISS
jgi:uncharacterized membrane protein